VDRAMQTINSQMLTIPDEHRQLEVAVQLIDALEPLFGLSAKVRRAELDAQLNPTSKPSATQPTAQELADRRLQALEEAKRLEQLRFDPKARDDLRHVVAKNFGLLQWLKLLSDQEDYLNPKDTTAAFDSELAMVRWLAYKRVTWCANPLN